MATIRLQCNSLASSRCLLLAENSVTGRAYMYEGSADVSLAEIH